MLSFGGSMVGEPLRTQAFSSRLPWSWALRSLELMSTQQIRRDSTNHNSVISACEKSGTWSTWILALQCLAQLPEDALLGSIFRGFVPNCCCWRVDLIFAFCFFLRRDEISIKDRIWRFFSRFDWDIFGPTNPPSPGFKFWREATARLIPDVITYNASISACQKAGTAWTAGRPMFTDSIVLAFVRRSSFSQWKSHHLASR